MLFQVRLLCGFVGAEVARIRPVFGVRPIMLEKVVLVSDLLAALRTHYAPQAAQASTREQLPRLVAVLEGTWGNVLTVFIVTRVSY